MRRAIGKPPAVPGDTERNALSSRIVNNTMSDESTSGVGVAHDGIGWLLHKTVSTGTKVNCNEETVEIISILAANSYHIAS